jgi:hypothetical protein
MAPGAGNGGIGIIREELSCPSMNFTVLIAILSSTSFPAG